MTSTPFQEETIGHLSSIYGAIIERSYAVYESLYLQLWILYIHKIWTAIADFREEFITSPQLLMTSILQGHVILTNLSYDKDY